MGLHKLVGGSFSPIFRMLRFQLKEENSRLQKQPIFFLGSLLPSCVVFVSDGAQLSSCFS